MSSGNKFYWKPTLTVIRGTKAVEESLQRREGALRRTPTDCIPRLAPPYASTVQINLFRTAAATLGNPPTPPCAITLSPPMRAISRGHTRPYPPRRRADPKMIPVQVGADTAQGHRGTLRALGITEVAAARPAGGAHLAPRTRERQQEPDARGLAEITAMRGEEEAGEKRRGRRGNAGRKEGYKGEREGKGGPALIAPRRPRCTPTVASSTRPTPYTALQRRNTHTHPPAPCKYDAPAAANTSSISPRPRRPFSPPRLPPEHAQGASIHERDENDGGWTTPRAQVRTAPPLGRHTSMAARRGLRATSAPHPRRRRPRCPPPRL
ncbi:hypothetical protein DFH09DRAFT_1359661 [Mycena vulgaris]|nr:hypothetical protein DFH09DRAFT_1359661 [Mycena vulgaris]